MSAFIVYGFFVGSLLLLFLVISRRAIPTVWLLAWGVAPLVLIYVLNPDFRVYSFHSFMHAGIIYQIMNGNLPPGDPLLAGYAVHYPWGGHLLAAGISSLAHVTPFYAVAVMNVVSLCLSMVLVYHVSRLVVRDRTANILSVVAAIFAITPFTPGFINAISDRIPTEIRGVPIFHKFVTINTLPMGLVFFLLALYFGIRLLQEGRLWRNAALGLASTMGCGFLYPAFLPGLIAGSVVAAASVLILQAAGRVRVDFIRVVVALGTLAVAVVVLRPYLLTAGAGSRAGLRMFWGPAVRANLVRYLLNAGPMILIIGLSLKPLLKQAARPAALVLASMAAATFVSYTAIHVPMDNEYKFMLLSMLAVGIIGGPALGIALKRFGRPAVFVLLALFMLPFFRTVHIRVVRGGGLPGSYVERGTDVISTDAEEAELYAWLREHTTPRAIFIDTALEVPVLARRQIYIALPGRQREDQKGYGRINLIMQVQSGYDHSMLQARRSVADKIYANPERLTSRELDDLRSLHGPVYVIDRDHAPEHRLSRPDFEQVYRSSRGTYTVYALR